MWAVPLSARISAQSAAFSGDPLPLPSFGSQRGKKPSKSTAKLGTKFDPRFVQIAGPELSPASFAGAILSAEIPNSAANAAFAEWWAKRLRAAARHCVFKKRTPPVNVVGGYRFPDPPTIELDPQASSTRSPTAACVSGDFTIPDDLSIPNFLRRGAANTVRRRRAAGRLVVANAGVRGADVLPLPAGAPPEPNGLSTGTTEQPGAAPVERIGVGHSGDHPSQTNEGATQ